MQQHDHSEVEKGEVGENEDHHHVLQQIDRIERSVREEIALRHAGAEDEHALDYDALQQRQRQNGEETPHRVGLRVDGRGAVGIRVEPRVGEQLLVGVNAFDDESSDGNLEIRLLKKRMAARRERWSRR